MEKLEKQKRIKPFALPSSTDIELCTQQLVSTDQRVIEGNSLQKNAYTNYCKEVIVPIALHTIAHYFLVLHALINWH
jgi:hypothetical protein